MQSHEVESQRHQPERALAGSPEASRDPQFSPHVADSTLNTSFAAPSGEAQCPTDSVKENRPNQFAFRALKRVGQLINPLYHLQEFKKDYQAFQDSRRSNYHEVASDFNGLSTSIQGKLFSSLILSNIIGYTVGAVASAAYQAATGSPIGAVLVNLGASYAGGFLSFQALWALSNNEMYREKYSTPVERIVEFEKDLWPCHKKAFTAALQCYLISVPLSLAVGGGVALLGETAARYLPTGFLSFALTTPLVEGLFIRLLGDFHSRYCSDLAGRYLKSKSPTS